MTGVRVDPSPPPTSEPRSRLLHPVPPGSLVVGAEDALPGEAAVLRAAERSLSGERRGLGRFTPFLGPAFIASVAYVDPGNFATNMAGGAKFGYLLLWVVLVANLMAMLIQSMSAKLGIATGMNLPEVCRERFPRTATFLLWVQAELIAMATDIAEFVGAAIGINLLTGLPLFPAALLTGVAAFAILALQSRGFRKLEAVIAAFVGVIVVAFGFQVFLADPSASDIAHGLFVPGFDGTESVLLAVGILGATCMPHVIYLHSALTQQRIVGATEEARKKIFRFELVDVVIAMTIAGLINMSMLITAAAVFHSRGLDDVGDDLNAVYDGLDTYLGSSAAIMFGVALLASGLSSSSVGTMAGPGRDAGLHQPADPAPAAAGDHDGARPADHRNRGQPREGPDPEPGGAVVRHPVRAHPAGDVLSQPGTDGRARQPPVDDRRGSGGDDRDRCAERLPARADPSRLSPSAVSARARRRAAPPRAPARARVRGRSPCTRASPRRCRRSSETGGRRRSPC